MKKINGLAAAAAVASAVSGGAQAGEINQGLVCPAGSEIATRSWVAGQSLRMEQNGIRVSVSGTPVFLPLGTYATQAGVETIAGMPGLGIAGDPDSDKIYHGDTVRVQLPFDSGALQTVFGDANINGGIFARSDYVYVDGANTRLGRANFSDVGIINTRVSGGETVITATDASVVLASMTYSFCVNASGRSVEPDTPDTPDTPATGGCHRCGNTGGRGTGGDGGRGTGGIGAPGGNSPP